MIAKIILLLALLTTNVLHAAGDPNAGKKKSIVCSACHGVQGISTNPDWPNLAGQHANYIIKQLHDFKQGKTRQTPNAPLMAPMVAPLSDKDMDDLAAFYAQQSIPASTPSKKAQVHGEQLYRRGDVNKQITACIVCHGPQGTGNAQAGFPVLAGQHSEYIIQQLQAFKKNQRLNDLNSIMRDICGRMSTEDMEAVAYYLNTLGST